MHILILVVVIAFLWGIFVLDAYLVTKAPKRRHLWQRPSREEEDDLLYTPPRMWVHRARKEVKEDD